MTAERLVRHRGGLRLPVRRVLHRRRRHLDPSARRSRRRERQWTRRPGRTQSAGGRPEPVPVPLPDRRRRHWPARSSTTSSIKTGGTTLFTDDVESGANGWTADGWFRLSTGTEVTNARPLLPRSRTARTSATTHTLRDRAVPVQLGLHAARLGRALPVPGRPARLDRRRELRRQQHHRPPRRGLRAAGRRPPGTVHLPGRHAARATGASRSTRRSACTQLDAVCLHKQVAVKAKGKTTIETLRRATTPPGPRRRRSTTPTPTAYWRERQPAQLGQGRGRRRQGHRDQRGRQRPHRPRRQPAAEVLTG